ncbi:membrane protein, putative [Babesia bigemina]|uniref:Membrane protein, putative n=1 Tax=Babesia bigemina TaxID=5866 RepID=A0A061DCK2_BABBI|nr:membrane protein, putative [Babesia bigemina]CDR96759.1 membrane protein, putative [Babesia bigemina]|eukprot:XP_012768945.1 membrane protein, putative [Babesia bigemina]
MDNAEVVAEPTIGTMEWLDKNLKKMMIVLSSLSLLFCAALCGYTVYIFGYIADKTMYNLAVMMAVFVAALTLSDIVGLFAAALESEGFTALFTYNNMCATITTLVLSGVHFGKAVYIGKQFRAEDNLASTFFVTATGLITMAILHATMVFIGFRYKRLLSRRANVIELKLNDTVFTTINDLNQTQAISFPKTLNAV